MDGQMSIFDCFPMLTEISIEDMTEEYLVQRVSEATGLTFEKINAKWLENDYYRAKWKKAQFDIEINQYAESVNNGRKFIGVDYSYSHGGKSSPCDSLDEAIRFLKKTMSEHEKG